MSDEVWAHIIERIAADRYQGSVAFLLQCEPLLDSKLIQRIEEVKQISKKIPVWLFTNASLLTPAYARNLKEVKVDSITMSLLASTKDEYNTLTGLDFDTVYNNIVKAILLLSNSSTFTSINASLGSWEEKENYLDIFKHFSAKLRFNIRDSRGGFFEDLHSKYDDWCLACVNSSKSFCDQPTHTLPIMADGSIRLCTSDWTGETTSGSILVSTLSSLRKSDELSRKCKNLELGTFDYTCCKSCYKELGLGNI
jgi:MoaA/NifB/PqqE/SkfB family radical SAM enzyme